MKKERKISDPVIKRLPRYYRFLGELAEKNVQRISSRELSDKMGLTASQIRQDLNCFGGFGQQGYGYSVKGLRDEIGHILGIDNKTDKLNLYIVQWYDHNSLQYVEERLDQFIKIADYRILNY